MEEICLAARVSQHLPSYREVLREMKLVTDKSDWLRLASVYLYLKLERSSRRIWLLKYHDRIAECSIRIASFHRSECFEKGNEVATLRESKSPQSGRLN